MNCVLPAIAVVSCLVVFSAPPAHADSVLEIAPMQATSVGFEKPDDVSASKILLGLCNRSWMPGDSATFDVPLIEFDLTEVAPDSKVSKAILRLVPYGIGSTESRPVIRLHPIQTEWSEQNATWNTKPAWDENFLEIEIPQQPNEWNPWEIDITPLVRKWLSGSMANHGLAIVAESTRGDLHNFAFFGRSNTDGRAPKLLITLDKD